MCSVVLTDLIKHLLILILFDTEEENIVYLILLYSQSLGDVKGGQTLLILLYFLYVSDPRALIRP